MKAKTKTGISAIFALSFAAVVAIGSSERVSAFTNWINVWAPFNGTWNLGDQAPPENHAHPWGGDFATDYYKAPGNTGYFGISNSNSGNANGWIYANDGGNSSCSGSAWAGYSYKIQVYDDYQNRGWVLLAHVDATDSQGSTYFLPEQTVIDPWDFVGRTKFWTYNDPCWKVTTNAGVHWHVEMKNAIANYACYSYAYESDKALTTSDTLGAVGSNATWSPPYCGGP